MASIGHTIVHNANRKSYMLVLVANMRIEICSKTFLAENEFCRIDSWTLFLSLRFVQTEDKKSGLDIEFKVSAITGNIVTALRNC
jgi:hypothetical protein